MIDESMLKQLFLEARTHNGWTSEPVTDEQLRRLWALARMGPTSMNLSPMRLHFVKSAAAKEKLRPALSAGNVDKTMAAPVTAIVAFDVEFYEKGSVLMPHRDAKATFTAMPVERRERFALMNGSLQGGYLILAARSLGLDCGPMGGFNSAQVDETFFKGTSWRSNFLLNLGHGDPAKLYPRAPRLEFDDACRIE